MCRSILLGFLSILILIGCSSNKAIGLFEKENEKLEKTKNAYRFKKVEIGGGYSIYELEPAGVVGKSVVKNSEVVEADVFKGIKEQCGFEKNSLIETRLVSHEHPHYYEVWVFKDNQSERKDKQSAISVILNQYPNSGGVDIFLSKDCHPKPLSFLL